MTGLAAVKRQVPIGDPSLIGRTPPPRSIGGTHPGRISHVRNTENPAGSGPPGGGPGRPTVRNAEFSAGNRMPKKRMPDVPGTAPLVPGESKAPRDESQQETRTSGGTSRPSFLDNWPDTGTGARALERGADMGR